MNSGTFPQFHNLLNNDLILCWWKKFLSITLTINPLMILNCSIGKYWIVLSSLFVRVCKHVKNVSSLLTALTWKRWSLVGSLSCNPVISWTLVHLGSSNLICSFVMFQLPFSSVATFDILWHQKKQLLKHLMKPLTGFLNLQIWSQNISKVRSSVPLAGVLKH